MAVLPDPKAVKNKANSREETPHGVTTNGTDRRIKRAKQSQSPGRRTATRAGCTNKANRYHYADREIGSPRGIRARQSQSAARPNDL